MQLVTRQWGSDLWLRLSSASRFYSSQPQKFYYTLKGAGWAASCVMDGVSLCQSYPVVWQEFFNSAQSQLASERRCSHLVPVTGGCQGFVCSHHLQTHGVALVPGSWEVSCAYHLQLHLLALQPGFSFGPSAANLVGFSSKCHIPLQRHFSVLDSLFVTAYQIILPNSYGFKWLGISIW